MPVHIGKKVQWLKTSLLTQNIKHRKICPFRYFFSLFYTFRLPLCQNFWNARILIEKFTPEKIHLNSNNTTTQFKKALTYTREPSCPMITHGKSHCPPPLTFFKKKSNVRSLTTRSVLDLDLQIREGGRSSRPWDKGKGPGLKKNIFGPFGPHLGLKIWGRGGGGVGEAPRDTPLFLFLP